MNEKINVLYLINYAGQGGSEKYLNILTDNMSQRVNAFLAYNVEGSLVKEFEEKNIKCFQLNMRRPFDFKASKELAQIVKENNIDIIHSNYLRENYIAILARLFGSKAKVVYTCHFNQNDSSIVTVFNKIFYKKLSQIISISNEVTKSLVKSGSPKEKITMIYHGTKVSDEISPSAKAKEGFGVDKNEFVISCASRFSPEKGNEFLINSIKSLKDKIENENKANIKFKVLLANEGETLERCQGLVQELGLSNEIKFVGYMKNVEELYLASDVCMTPSKSEGLGLAVIEALSYGVPNIVTRIGGLTEIVNDNSKCGLIVEYGNQDELSDAILTILENETLREVFKKNAKETVRNNFSIENMIAKTYEVYEKSCNYHFNSGTGDLRGDSSL